MTETTRTPEEVARAERINRFVASCSPVVRAMAQERAEEFLNIVRDALKDGAITSENLVDVLRTPLTGAFLMMLAGGAIGALEAQEAKKVTSLPTRPCQKCGKPIVFAAFTKSDGAPGMIPLDPKAPCYRVTGGGLDHDTQAVRDTAAMVSHFTTCSDPGRFSRSQGPSAQDEIDDLRAKLQRERDANVALRIAVDNWKKADAQQFEGRLKAERERDEALDRLAVLEAGRP